VLAVAYTGYCLAAPKLKERRFAQMFGADWEAYRARVPYWLPWPRPKGRAGHG
jgi:protein-S-isoprenylcysteine O-methyltransferase Ste14